jgi:hypothetical protein
MRPYLITAKLINSSMKRFPTPDLERTSVISDLQFRVTLDTLFRHIRGKGENAMCDYTWVLQQIRYTFRWVISPATNISPHVSPNYMCASTDNNSETVTCSPNSGYRS